MNSTGAVPSADNGDTTTSACPDTCNVWRIVAINFIIIAVFFGLACLTLLYSDGCCTIPCKSRPELDDEETQRRKNMIKSYRDRNCLLANENAELRAKFEELLEQLHSRPWSAQDGGPVYGMSSTDSPRRPAMEVTRSPPREGLDKKNIVTADKMVDIEL